MTNEEMRHRMEAVKLLLQRPTDLINGPIPDRETLILYSNQLKALEFIYDGESKEYMETVPSKERSMEVLALMGFIDLQIKEHVQMIIKKVDDLPKEEQKVAQSAHQIDPNHPLASIINDLAAKGVDVEVLDLRLKEDCGNPNCPVHHPKKKKETTGENNN